MVVPGKDRAEHLWLGLMIVITLLLASCGGRVAQPGASPAAAASQTAASSGPASCPVTKRPDPPFVPPAPYSKMPLGDRFWYGTSALWSKLDPNGYWSGLPHGENGYTQKVFWWRQGYDWRSEPAPALTVTGRRIDEPAPPLVASKATNAFADDIGSAMLVGVELPAAGCWEITGHLRGADLSFVVWVGL